MNVLGCDVYVDELGATGADDRFASDLDPPALFDELIHVQRGIDEELAELLDAHRAAHEPLAVVPRHIDLSSTVATQDGNQVDTVDCRDRDDVIEVFHGSSF